MSDQARIGDFGHSGSAAELDALRARVAELEKDEALRGPRLQALADMSDRALSAEAGLAAAQEALKVYAALGPDDIPYADTINDPPDVGRVARDALARGGGQQEPEPR